MQPNLREFLLAGVFVIRGQIPAQALALRAKGGVALALRGIGHIVERH